MILGIGIDLVELDRIDIHKARFVERILSTEELEIFTGITNEDRKKTYLGGRFAAKEALFKAFSKGDMSANFKEFTVLNDINGKPFVKSKHITNDMVVHISISHTAHYATAYVMLSSKVK